MPDRCFHCFPAVRMRVVTNGIEFRYRTICHQVKEVGGFPILGAVFYRKQSDVTPSVTETLFGPPQGGSLRD